eukprot:CAMPEP_0174267566 /NCGR_PEP_ID=MMETSP0439-20130205/34062_1 /TAXON_ID=0 /ORGANISM="Stereomyxa ramosa, Strain Chinc5" /LENGTH=149 /DNA_ID=CAMNT_0015355129 /DNA_START=72 /DNA_END=518 /DNA_ORIENTATION=+
MVSEDNILAGWGNKFFEYYQPDSFDAKFEFSKSPSDPPDECMNALFSVEFCVLRDFLRIVETVVKEVVPVQESHCKILELLRALKMMQLELRFGDMEEVYGEFWPQNENRKMLSWGSLKCWMSETLSTLWNKPDFPDKAKGPIRDLYLK